jgi:hypothetical protein
VSVLVIFYHQGGLMQYVIVFVLSVVTFFTQANSSLPNNRHVLIVGSAKLNAKPDIAVISLAVESLKSQSLDAKREVDNRVNNFLDGLAQFAINEDNVSASSISAQPNYRYTANNKKEVDGYIAKRTLKVTLNNLKHLNAFMDFALSKKINEIRNIELKSSNADALKDEVNALAVANAKAKGHSLAKAFDAKLGKIYSINSTSNSSRYRYGANHDVEQMEITALRTSQPDRAGKYLQENIIFSASISVVFDLEVK